MIFNYPDLLHVWLNMIILGPSGQGKSTFLKYVAIEFMRQGGRVIWLDLFKSCFSTTHLLNGSHINLGNMATENFFAPFKTLSTPKTVEFLCMLCKHQGINITPEIKTSLLDTVKIFQNQCFNQQTISTFLYYLQNDEIKSTLSEYTANGSCALFDAAVEQIDFSQPWICFEVKELFDNEDMLQIVLFYLLSRIEALSDGIPTIFVIDDAGHVLADKKFRKWLSVSLNNFRKKNISFWFAFHNVSDFDNEIRDTILNACKLKMFTPNDQILSNNFIKTGYQNLGLSDTQLELLGKSTPSRDYMIQVSSGKTQLIDLMIGPGSVSQIVCGGSEIDSISLMENLLDGYAHDEAIKRYLKAKGGRINA